MIYVILVLVTLLADRTYLFFFGKEEKKPSSQFQAWKDFIIANINSCKHTEQCNTTYQLLQLFASRFKNDVTQKYFVDTIEMLGKRIDSKYKSIIADQDFGRLEVNDHGFLSVVK